MPVKSTIGSFIPTTATLDVSQLYQVNIDDNFRELLVRLYRVVNDIAISMENRDAGLYVQEEFINGQKFFPNANTAGQAPLPGRQAYRKVINFGQLPNGVTKSVAHGINVLTPGTTTTNFKFTRIYATATNPTTPTFIPIPYVSPISPNDDIALTVNQTNVEIYSGADYSAFTECYVVLEFVKY